MLVWLAPKILAVFLAMVVVSRSYVDFRTRGESLKLFLFWCFTWTVIVIVALFPWVIDFVTSFFGGRGGGAGVGTFLGMALVFMFFIVYRIYAKLERLEQMLTQAIREMALREPWKTTK